CGLHGDARFHGVEHVSGIFGQAVNSLATYRLRRSITITTLALVVVFGITIALLCKCSSIILLRFSLLVASFKKSLMFELHSGFPKVLGIFCSNSASKILIAHAQLAICAPKVR